MTSETQVYPQPQLPHADTYGSGSDASTIDHLLDRFDRWSESSAMFTPTPLHPQSSLDALMADLLRPAPQPTAPTAQPPPLVPLVFCPDLHTAWPRSVSPTVQMDLPPRPNTVPVREELVIFVWQGWNIPHTRCPLRTAPLAPIRESLPPTPAFTPARFTEPETDFNRHVREQRQQQGRSGDGFYDVTCPLCPPAGPVIVSPLTVSFDGHA